MPHEQNSHTDYDQALKSAAETWGIQPDYWDIWGKHHFTSAEVQKAVLSSLGVPTDNAESLHQATAKAENPSLLIPPVVVTPQRNSRVPVRAEDGAKVDGELECEDGKRLRVSDTVKDGSISAPADAPLGYHTLRIQSGGQKAEARLVLCPDRAYLPEPPGKRAGIAISLYGLRSERNWGCGDFTDLEAFTTWATRLKVAFIALNPLHALANRQPYNTSPYLPESSFYRNPLYLDVERVPDLPSCYRSDKLDKQVRELRSAKYVEYEKVYKLKLRYLRAAFRRFLEREYRPKTKRGQDFQRFIDNEGDLLDRYATYCALFEVLHRRNPDLWIWPDWPAEYQDPTSAATSGFAREHKRTILFFKYMQWLVDQQLAAAQKHAKDEGLSIGLYHDLALATDRCGSDLWAYREFFVAGCRVGAPPDDFSPKGQDWAFPAPNTQQHRTDGYHLFSESIRKNLRHGGALRIDHVMRFFRLFWIPEGKDPTEGAYVKDHPEDLIHILALESVRNQVVVIGEDLGTVEPSVRESLARFGVLSYRLLYFEKDKQGRFIPPAKYPEQALVSASTHDLPTLAGFWSGADIHARKQGGLIDDPSEQRQWRERNADKQVLLDKLFELNLLPESHPRNAAEIPELTGELHNAMIGFLVSTPSYLMVLNQEDLFKDPDQQNLPGSTEQYPNWRHKMRFTLEELNDSSEVAGYVAMFRAWVDRSGRADTGARG